MTWKRLLWALVVTIGVLHARDASAQASCTISATSVNFGNYNVFSATNLDSTGTITFQCNASAANIYITLSKGSSSTYNPRTMKQGTETLNYNLYRNAARTNIWGDATGGTVRYNNANPPNNSNVNLTIYGRVPAGQDVSAGSYGDTISATINF